MVYYIIILWIHSESQHAQHCTSQHQLYTLHTRMHTARARSPQPAQHTQQKLQTAQNRALIVTHTVTHCVASAHSTSSTSTQHTRQLSVIRTYIFNKNIVASGLPTRSLTPRPPAGRTHIKQCAYAYIIIRYIARGRSLSLSRLLLCTGCALCF